MRSLQLFWVLLLVFAFVGCDKGGVKYESLEKIQSRPEYEEFEYVATVRITDPDKVDEPSEDCEGPYRLLRENTEKEVNKDPFHRKVTYDDEDLYIKRNGLLGYKTKLLLLENKDGKKCLALLRSKTKVRDYGDDGPDGGFAPSQ